MDAGGVALGVLALLVLAGRKKRAHVPHDTRTPAVYAAQKLDTLKARASGKLGDSLARLHGKLWPGVPVEAFEGFTAISKGATENTTVGDPEQKFHELGYFQTPAGPRAGPAPNPDPAVSHWAREAKSDLVKTALGREGTLDPAKWPTAIDDQVAIGLADISTELQRANYLIGDLAVTDPKSTWAVGLGFMSFSAGGGTAAKWVNLYKARLAGTPEKSRWSKWGELIAADVARGVKWEKGRHKNPGASYLRTWQKLESGRLLAHARGTGGVYDRWYDAPSVDPAPIMRAAW